MERTYESLTIDGNLHGLKHWLNSKAETYFDFKLEAVDRAGAFTVILFSHVKPH